MENPNTINLAKRRYTPGKPTSQSYISKSRSSQTTTKGSFHAFPEWTTSEHLEESLRLLGGNEDTFAREILGNPR